MIPASDFIVRHFASFRLLISRLFREGYSLKKSYIRWIKDVSRKDLGEVGGKGGNLGELVKAGVPVPNAFITTSTAYFDFVRENKLDVLIKKELTDLDPEDSKALQAKSKIIRQAILDAKLSSYFIKAIDEAYKRLGEDSFVAVRSSATAEDLPDASFAGQQETYLNVRGKHHVVHAVHKAYGSLFGPRAIYYRTIHNYDHLKVGIAVPVQMMIASEKSGIMFTTNPVNNDDNEIVIEAGLGLGETIVSGSVNPDHFVVAKHERKIKEKEIGRQAFQITYRHGKNAHISLSDEEKGRQKISDEEIMELREFALAIEKYYGAPQDTEWAFGAPAGVKDGKSKLYFVQSRPITTLKMKPESRIQNQVYNIPDTGFKIPNSKSSIPDSGFKIPDSPPKGELGEKLISGVASSVGVATGPVKIISKPSEIGQIKEGDVMVTEMTNPSYVPAMRKAVAIITDTGGATSHAAIVSRELGKPAVVGTGKATTVLKDGQIVTVDGASGVVYKGSIAKSAITDHHRQSSNPETGIGFDAVNPASHNQHGPVTGTKVYVNIAEPSEAKRVAELPCDGVGLLRAEFMIATLGDHPKALVKAGKSKLYVAELVKGIQAIASAFNPRPVVYRASDFKTNEYKGLKGGEKYEPEEENPMIGFRGAMRYIKDPDLFALELKAIKEVRDKYELRNVHLMIPFVRTVDEFRQVKKLVEKAGLKQSKDFKLWIMVEVPATVIMIEEFCKEGIDGVSIGSNDLTQLTLGVDRDNGGLAESFDERDEAVRRSLERVVKVTHRHGVTASICGNAASVYPEVLETCVKAGITSVSVTPDRVLPTRKLVASIERRVLLDHATRNDHHPNG